MFSQHGEPGIQIKAKVVLKANNIQIWTGYERNSTKYMPEGVPVDNYFTRP